MFSRAGVMLFFEKKNGDNEKLPLVLPPSENTLEMKVIEIFYDLLF